MKVPKAKKMKSGLWQIRLYINGQYIYVDDVSESAVKKKATAIKAECLTGKKVAVIEDISLAEAIDRYIEARSNVLSPSTIRGYRMIQRNRMRKYISLPIKSITNWQRVINDEAKEVCPKTVHNIYGLLKAVLRENGIEISCKLPQEVPPDTKWLTPEQIPLFLEAIRGEPCEIAALLGLHSLRRSEMLAIKKEAIHDGYIHVNGSRVVDTDNRLIFKNTNKNSYSNRIIPIMIERLSELVSEAPEGYLITINQDNIRKQINRVCKRNGLPEISVHGLRRSFASLAYHIGLSERDTMQIGGWNCLQTMHKKYVKLSSNNVENKANLMKRFYNSI